MSSDRWSSAEFDTPHQNSLCQNSAADILIIAKMNDFRKMNIRPATLDDFGELYAIGKNTPELQVSATEEFMDADEFKWSIANPHGVFLVAEEKHQKIGFIYANAKDMERPFEHKYACLVYLVVIPEFRRQGVAQKLYSECERRVRKRGVTNIYCWANAEANGEIIRFMKRQGFAEGQRYSWMDKKIS